MTSSLQNLSPQRGVLFAVPPSLLNRRQVDEVFRDAGHAPIFVHSTRELDDALRRTGDAIVFLDLLFDGDFLSVMGRLRRRPHVEVVVLAEQLSEREQRALREQGASGCLLRPVHAVKLLRRALGPPAAAAGAVPPSPPEFPALREIEAWVESCAKVARRVEARTPLNGSLWPAAVTSPADLARLGYSGLQQMAQRALAASRNLIRAERCTLLSLRPDALWPESECPLSVRPLASSGTAALRKDPLPTALFPQIALAHRRREAIFVPQGFPPHLAGQVRPAELMLKGHPEKASAVFPVFDGKRLFGAVLCQFSSFESAHWPLLEQTMLFFEKASQGWAQLDFINRIYAQRI